MSVAALLGSKACGPTQETLLSWDWASGRFGELKLLSIMYGRGGIWSCNCNFFYIVSLFLDLIAVFLLLACSR